jgi:hypothetical protein
MDSGFILIIVAVCVCFLTYPLILLISYIYILLNPRTTPVTTVPVTTVPVTTVPVTTVPATVTPFSTLSSTVFTPQTSGVFTIDKGYSDSCYQDLGINNNALCTLYNSTTKSYKTQGECSKNPGCCKTNCCDTVIADQKNCATAQVKQTYQCCQEIADTHNKWLSSTPCTEQKVQCQNNPTEDVCTDVYCKWDSSSSLCINDPSAPVFAKQVDASECK